VLFKNILSPGGLLYLTINFDGLTIMEPEIDREFDSTIFDFYHRTLDERMVNGLPSGDSQSGRHLFHELRNVGMKVLETGSSDRIVAPNNGYYLADSAYFLHSIIHTVDLALCHRLELDQSRFAQWIQTRHAQVVSAELVYIAHQIDFLAEVTE
jgi:hypothetical protein